MKFAFVFPGQGSQSVGMMSAYGDAAIVRNTFAEASQALGRDLWQLASQGPAEEQSRTVNTQPLMLTAGIAVWRLWLDNHGPQPDLLAGHSLGEYSALVAAGVLTLAEAVPLVELRAQAMQEAVPAGTGAMAAILGLDAAAVAQACVDAMQGEVVQAVNFNSPEQTVIAGHKSAVERAAAACKAAGAKRAVMLPVSAPFHCALMQPAAEKLRLRLAAMTLAAPRIPVVNNADVSCLDSGDAIRDALVRQAASPVRWVETMREMQVRGVTHVFECGPGKVLAGLVKRCADGLVGAAINDRAGLDAALAAVRG